MVRRDDRSVICGGGAVLPLCRCYPGKRWKRWRRWRWCWRWIYIYIVVDDSGCPRRRRNWSSRWRSSVQRRCLSCARGRFSDWRSWPCWLSAVQHARTPTSGPHTSTEERRWPGGSPRTTAFAIWARSVSRIQGPADGILGFAFSLIIFATVCFDRRARLRKKKSFACIKRARARFCLKSGAYRSNNCLR